MSDKILTVLDDLMDRVASICADVGVDPVFRHQHTPDRTGRFVVIDYLPTEGWHSGYNGNGGVHTGEGWIVLQCCAPAADGPRDAFAVASAVLDRLRRVKSSCYSVVNAGLIGSDVDGGHHIVRVRARIRYYEEH